MENMINADDPLHLVDKIVFEVKSQGLFDRFRKECLSDVDTKPAYQNLRQRVENSVTTFLKDLKWSTELNKNHVREKLRKNITDSGYLDTGVERIVDQVVNPKIATVFLSQVEQVVCKYLGIEKLPYKTAPDLKFLTNSTNGNLQVNTTDLLPTDLEAVSPDSDKSKSHHNSTENLNNESTLDDSFNETSDKLDDFESPPFEPLEGLQTTETNKDESMDSHLSDISGLTSQDSVPSDIMKEISLNDKEVVQKSEPEDVKDNIKEENSNSEMLVDTMSQDSQLSQVSSNSRLSIITNSESPKLEIDESNSRVSGNIKSETETDIKLPTTFEMIKDIKKEYENGIKNENNDSTEIENDIKMEVDVSEDKPEFKLETTENLDDSSQMSIKDVNSPKPKESPKEKSSSSSKSSPHDSSRDSSKHRGKDYHSSSKSSRHDRDREKDRGRDRDRERNRDKDRKYTSDDKHRSSDKSSKYRYHSSSSSRDASVVSDRKDDNDKKNLDSDSNSSKRDRSRERSRDYHKHSSSKSSSTSRSSSSKSKEHYRSSSKSSRHSKDYHRSSSSSKSSSNKDKSSSSSYRDHDKKSIESSDKKRNDKKSDDHFSARKDRNSEKRRSTDGDSNDGSSRFNFHGTSNDVSTASSTSNSTQNSSTNSPTQTTQNQEQISDSIQDKSDNSAKETTDFTYPKVLESSRLSNIPSNNVTEDISKEYYKQGTSDPNRSTKVVFDNTMLNSNIEIMINDNIPKSIDAQLCNYIKKRIGDIQKSQSNNINLIDFRHFTEEEIAEANHINLNFTKLYTETVEYETYRYIYDYQNTAFVVDCDNDINDLIKTHYNKVIDLSRDDPIDFLNSNMINNKTIDSSSTKLFCENNRINLTNKIITETSKILNAYDASSTKDTSNSCKRSNNSFTFHNNNNVKKMKLENDSNIILNLNISETVNSPEPPESDGINSQILSTEKRRRSSAKTTQCYSSDDLYKPRTMFGQRSRRRGIDSNDIII